MVLLKNYKEPVYAIGGNGLSNQGVIIGKSFIMKELFSALNRLALLPTTVLLTGETGTGKELFARALHFNGRCCSYQFVAVNCAGIPSELLESELFGHVKGAFTGAYRTREGKFQYAGGGTIFLDEIGDMSMFLQAKILRVLQEKKVTMVGSNIAQDVNVRVVAATNRNLENEVAKGRFREDLYYRLNVIPIKIPPLRERKEDIVPIAEHLIREFNVAYGARISGLTSDACEKLNKDQWKGNVRELENVLERVFIQRTDGFIDAEDLFFNSDSPIYVLSQCSEPPVIEVPDKPKDDINLEANVGGGQLWYENGVLPTFVAGLNGDGLRTGNNICSLLNAGKLDSSIFFETIGDTRASEHRILYLTPENVMCLFRYGIKDYSEWVKRIQNDRFGKIARAPFKFFTLTDLIENANTITQIREIRQIIKECDAYVIGRNPRAVAITKENAGLFIRQHGIGDKIDRERKLIEEIERSYEAFKGWKPDLNLL